MESLRDLLFRNTLKPGLREGAKPAEYSCQLASIASLTCWVPKVY